MRVRREQFAVMNDGAHCGFENFLVGHLAGFTPLHSKSLGDAGIRALIREGVDKARGHGMTSRGPVRLYVELIVLLGIDFDTDPQYSRAGETLRDLSLGDETERADWLHDQVMGLLETVGGPNREYAIRSLRRSAGLPLHGLRIESPEFGEFAIRQMREIYPEKVDYVGEPALLELASRAAEEARVHGIATNEGVNLLLGLMFAVGHGCTRDPKYPWIAGTLANPKMPQPEKRVERLYAKSMTYLEAALQHMDAR
jgi:hypothetical protein